MVRIGAIALGAGCFELFHLNIKVDDDNGQKSYSIAFFLHPLLFSDWSAQQWYDVNMLECRKHTASPTHSHTCHWKCAELLVPSRNNVVSNSIELSLTFIPSMAKSSLCITMVLNLFITTRRRLSVLSFPKSRSSHLLNQARYHPLSAQTAIVP